MAKPNPPAEIEVQAGEPLLPNWKEQSLFWSIAGVGIAADLWTKSAVHAWLKDLPGQVYPVIDSCLQLVLRENTGAAFSMAQGKTGMLAIVSMVAMVAVVGFFLFGKVRSRLLQVALALFLGPAVQSGRGSGLYRRLLGKIPLAGLQCRRQYAMHGDGDFDPVAVFAGAEENTIN
jgi:hypothetical protein